MQQPAEAAEEPSELRQAVVAEEALPSVRPEEEQLWAQQKAAAVEAPLSGVQEAAAAQPWGHRPVEVAAAEAQPSAERVVEVGQPWAALAAAEVRLSEVRAVAEEVRPSARRRAARPWAAASACHRDRARLAARPARGPWVRCGAATHRT